jgi:hypothetical protein
VAERSFDDLDYYDLFIVEVEHAVLGFRTYFRGPKPNYTLVAAIPLDLPDATDLIGEITGVPVSGVDVYDELW